MSAATAYPKRLIEVDLPIARISAHARREKSIRHGHISTLHIWWARRPLAACRSVILAALWPDPAPSPDDPPCPPAFIDAARSHMLRWARDCAKKAGPESFGRLTAIEKNPALLDDPLHLRTALLDFIADFANWDNSTDEDYLETSRALVQAAHEALGGEPGTRPLVVDPFAGGGSIPLEALRVGADAFASDLNPVAVLLNKVVLEYIPKYGQRLADEVRKRGDWIKREAEKELAEFYPKDSDGAAPIAYLWARTIQCEGPGCGAEVPLIRSVWLAKRRRRSVALQLMPDQTRKAVTFQILVNEAQGWTDSEGRIVEGPKFQGTVKRGSATCPCCGYTTAVGHVRDQLRERQGGTADALLYCKVVRTEDNSTEYRHPTDADYAALGKANDRLTGEGAGLPPLSLPPDGALGFRVQKYGILQWEDLFLGRQKLQLLTFLRIVRSLSETTELERVMRLLFGITVSKLSSFSSSLCVWRNVRTCVAQTFGRQTLSMVWDFGEMNPFADSAGDFGEATKYLTKLVQHIASIHEPGTAQEADATRSPLADASGDLLFTDPPYYDAIPYQYLSEFFVLWLGSSGILSFDANSVLRRRAEECIVDEGLGKTRSFFENKMSLALAEGRRVTKAHALGVVVFAHKSTAGWEAQLGAMLQAGWTVTSSWPIDTERTGRLRAQDSAALGSSVHITCRPREALNGSVAHDDVGDWRAVLAELPQRIHAWMPRLAKEGVVGADAIFACLGPALEVFSRYSRVEKSSGEAVTLREYLEHVWAAVSNEALSVIFKDADAAGLEPDARLTAMWLWTVGASKPSNGTTPTNGDGDDEADEENGEEGAEAKNPKLAGFALEFDAARKIAQGLGVHLEKLESLVEIKGETARLLPVSERTRHLFGKDSQAEQQKTPRGRKKPKQGSLFEELQAAELMQSGSASSGLVEASPGARSGLTVLDRIHQAMILFAAGRGEAMKRFLVDDGAGTDPRFWKLAQSLSALYPVGTDEKRWVDGVLARKKGLGFQA